jgi:hypothetical protein
MIMEKGKTFKAEGLATKSKLVEILGTAYQTMYTTLGLSQR